MESLYLDKEQQNIRLYRWLLDNLEDTFTESEAHQQMKKRRGLTEPDIEDTKKVLRKMRKMQMVYSDNVKDQTSETVYHKKELYKSNVGEEE